MNQLLSTSRLFRNLSDSDISFLLNSLEEKDYEKNQIIFRNGEPAHTLYFIVSGQVKLFNKRKGSDKEEVVCMISQHGHFCLAPVLSRELYHINAVATKDTTLAMISKPRLEELIDSSHAFSKNLIHVLASKECDLCEEVCDLSLSTTKERLAKYLYDESKRRGSNSFPITMRQSELASHLGLARETLSRDLSSFKKSGIIQMTRTDIIILDEPELRSIAYRSGQSAFEILE